MMSGVISRWHCGLEFGVLRPRRSLPGDLQCPGVYQTRRSNNKHFTTTSNHFIAIGEQNHSINQIHKFDYNFINLLPSHTKEERKKYTKKKSGYQKKQELIKRPRTFILNLIPQSTNHLFFKTHRTSLDVLDIASLDGVLEVDSAERARARVLALDRVGAGGAVVLVLVGAGTFAYLVELGVHVAGGV